MPPGRLRAAGAAVPPRLNSCGCDRGPGDVSPYAKKQELIMEEPLRTERDTRKESLFEHTHAHLDAIGYLPNNLTYYVDFNHV
jgi:hypothetical protein